MSEATVLHIVPSGDVWAIKRQGDLDAARLAPTREAAFDAARQVASREGPARIILHRDDGTIESQVSIPAPLPRDWVEWLASPPVLAGFAGALIVAGAAALFARRG